MFIGHFGVALAAKRVAPKVSLGTLFLSAQFVDLLWPVLLLLGLEHVRIDPGNTVFTPLDFYDYPITHSMLTAIGWSIAFGLTYLVTRKDRDAALVIGLLVFSHWLLDALTHRPDLPLAPGSDTFVGLGLWNSYFWTIVVELSLFLGGAILYVRAARMQTGGQRRNFWILASFLLVVWVANMLGPPPPSESAIGYAGLALWLLIPWAYWVDRKRNRQQTS